MVLQLGSPLGPGIQGGGHGPQGRDQVQELDGPFRFPVLGQLLPVGSRRRLAQAGEAVLEHQAHGCPGLPRTPVGQLVQEDQEQTERPAQPHLLRRLRGPGGRALGRQEQVAAALPQDLFQELDILARKSLVPDEFPGLIEARIGGLGAGHDPKHSRLMESCHLRVH